MVIFNSVLYEQGLELDDFVSGPRELLLKLVEENYPLPLNPEPVSSKKNYIPISSELILYIHEFCTLCIFN